MEIYKTKPDKYGWYLVIKKMKSGTINLYHKKVDGKHKENWSSIQIWGKEELKLLKKVLNEERQAKVQGR